MGSRPTRMRSVDIQPERVNGNMSKVSLENLRAENSQLRKRISHLEEKNVDKLLSDNERLKKQNEDLRNELIKIRQESEFTSSHAIAVPIKKTSDLSIRDGNLDALSDNNLTPSPTMEQKIHSDRSSSPGYSSCKTSPNVNDGRKRKIDPNSILQRMSDIDAYGQGLPLADSGLMVKSVRRVRSRKLKTTTSANNESSPTNSEGTTSPAEVSPNVEKGDSETPKTSEEGQHDSGVHTNDVDTQQTDDSQNPATSDILMT